MKRKTAALYDPYLDVLGGGEKHVLSILKVLQDEGFAPVVYWDVNLTKEIYEKLQISFQENLTFKENIFQDRTESVFSRMQDLKQHDILIYVTDGSYFFSTAKKTVIFCMVPQKSLYNMSAINKLKTMNSVFIANSKYTQKMLKNWHIDAELLYPYISEEFLRNFSTTKKKQILVVGRFFKQLHSKRQDIAIKWFNEFSQLNEFKSYKLILAGSLKDEDNLYFKELQELAIDNKQIIFKPNISFSELLSLYNESEIYWHTAGYEIDENKFPEKVEHLGITPLEAMASGCLVFAYKAGGLKEIIQDGKNGFLFSNKNDLLKNMQSIMKDEKKTKEIQLNAKEFVKNNFDYSVFTQQVKKTLL